MPDPIVVEPAVPARASVIWLHGLGASAGDFAGLSQELGLGAQQGVRFVLPNAPARAVTVNGGMAMPAWYDIRGFDIAAAEDAEGLVASGQRIARLIDHETGRGLDPGRIVLGGFSQGGALALHTGLRYPRELAGIVALSAYLPLHDRIDSDIAVANRATPIFMAHGDGDPVVAPELGARSRDILTDSGYDVAWHSYPMGHEVSAAELAALRDWLVAVLGD